MGEPMGAALANAFSKRWLSTFEKSCVIHESPWPRSHY
jgi:hypothetical protein